MVKQHINAAGKKVICHAEKRTCRYATLPETTDASPSEDLLQKMSELDNVIKVIDLEKTSLPAPSGHISQPGIIFNFYDEDYYNDSYADLTTEFESVIMRDLLSGIHGFSYYHEEYVALITPEYIKHAEDNDWANSSNFIITRTRGYYDEIDLEVELTPEFLQEVNEYNYRRANAQDTQGVLSYCRGKGIDTTGKTPLQAIQEQLKTENNGKKHVKVAKAERVEVESVRLENIIIPAEKHYNNVEPRKPESTLSKGKSIAGVVYKDPNGTLTLIDGYHRTKYLKEVEKRKRSAQYFVLSN